MKIIYMLYGSGSFDRDASGTEGSGGTKDRRLCVSSKNGVIDWESVAEADADFVMLRTGEGQASDVDAQFEANYEGAKAAGLKVVAYHVCCVRTPEAAVIRVRQGMVIMRAVSSAWREI